MKILIRSDIHWSQKSSIITQRGEKYSLRLEHLIDSVNWSERLAEEYKCDKIIDLGDFFNTSQISDEEMAALTEIKWSSIPHTFILGNHEIRNKNKEYSSLHIMKLLGFELISEPSFVSVNDRDLCYLPYMFEYPSLNEIFSDSKNKRIIFSHNDIKGVTIGGYTFDNGFSLEDISKNCELFLNGHIHSKGTYGNMLNVGNLCGQNFGENNVPHNAYILDTETMELKEFENPYAFNFYKINCINKINLPKFKNNSLVRVRVNETNLENVKSQLEQNNNVIDISYDIISKQLEEIEETEDVIQIDHLKALQDYILKELGNTEIIKEELDTLIS